MRCCCSPDGRLHSQALLLLRQAAVSRWRAPLIRPRACQQRGRASRARSRVPDLSARRDRRCKFAGMRTAGDIRFRGNARIWFRRCDGIGAGPTRRAVWRRWSALPPSSRFRCASKALDVVLSLSGNPRSRRAVSRNQSMRLRERSCSEALSQAAVSKGGTAEHPCCRGGQRGWRTLRRSGH